MNSPGALPAVAMMEMSVDQTVSSCNVFLQIHYLMELIVCYDLKDKTS